MVWMHYKSFVILCRNTSLAMGMCPQGHWEKVSKGSWLRPMSPFDHKVLDIRTASSSLESFEVSIEEGNFFQLIVQILFPQCLLILTFVLIIGPLTSSFCFAEFFLHRVIFLAFGIIMMSMASFLSTSLVFYYGSAMAIGVILVILVFLFQVM